MKAEQLLEHFERLSEAPDAIPRLRRFILDLAVRGKLVEQDPSDEPAAELLKRIAAEKARLVKTGEIRNQEKFEPGTEAEELFDVPNTWCWVPSIYPAYIISEKEKKIQTKDVLDKGLFPVVDQGKVFIRGFCNDPSRVIRVTRPLILFGDHTRETKLIDFDFVVGADGVKLLQPVSILTNYYFLALQWLPLDSRGYGRHFKLLRSSRLPIPPLAEQHRIIAKVDELMSLCDQLEAAKSEREQCRDSLVAASLQRLNQPAEEEEAFREHARFTFSNLPRITTRAAHIKQLRQTILNLAVRGKLVEQDPKDEPAEEQLERIIQAKVLLGRKKRSTARVQTEASGESLDCPLAAGWATSPLADLVTVLNGRAYKQSELLDAGTPVLRVGNLFTSNKWYYSSLELEEDKYCDDGDLIFAWSASFGPFIWNRGRVIYHYHIWKLPLHSSADLSRDYLYLYLQNKTAEIKAAGHGISMVHMTKEKMERLEVPLPPLAEQHRIVAKVDELMAICDQLEAQINATEQDSRRFLEAVLNQALSPAPAEAA